MSEQVPLDHLILNLLALAEAAPHLSPEVRVRLAGLADGLKPTQEGLSRIGLDIQIELMGEPAFDAALAAWDALLPERVGLNLGAVLESLGNNPEAGPASGEEPLLEDPLVPLVTITRQALKDPRTFAGEIDLLQRLAGLVRQRWPRSSSHE